MTKEVMQQALEALESSRIFVTTREKTKHPEGTEWYDSAITALREALAQPVQEPVARVAEVHMSRYTLEWTNGPLPEGTELFSAQPEQEPVAWRDPTNIDPGQGCTYKKERREKWPHIYTQALYTAPPQRPWQGLTPEEMKHLYPYDRSVWGKETYEAIEKALKDKNT